MCTFCSLIFATLQYKHKHTYVRTYVYACALYVRTYVCVCTVCTYVRMYMYVHSYHNYCHFTWSFTVVGSTVCSRAASRRTGRWSSCCWSTGPTSMRWTTRGGLRYTLPPAAATLTYAGQCHVYTYIRTYVLACVIIIQSDLLSEYVPQRTHQICTSYQMYVRTYLLSVLIDIRTYVVYVHELGTE